MITLSSASRRWMIGVGVVLPRSGAVDGQPSGIDTHAKCPLPPLLHRYAIFACTFDESLVESVDRKSLPANWRNSPPPARLQQIGDDWLRRGRSAVLRVPSAIIETETNYLFNPEHGEFGRIQIAEQVAFSLDLRLRQAKGIG